MTSDLAATGGAQAAHQARVSESPQWLRLRRRAAWDAVSSLAWPSSMRDEDWRRTDISKLRPADFDLDPRASSAAQATIATWDDLITKADPAACVVACDGSGQTVIRAAADLVGQGIIISSLADACEQHPDLVQLAMREGSPVAQPLTALWNALWKGGCFIYVPDGVSAAQPVWVIQAGGDAGSAAFPATVCVLGQAASLQVSEVYASAPDQGPLFCNCMSHLHVGRSAQLDYHVLQVQNQLTWHMATHTASLEADAHLNFFGVTTGSKLQKSYWEALLLGQGAEAQIGGVALGSARQHLDHQSLQAHRAPDTQSRFSLKVAVAGQSRSVYSGLIDVDHDAVRTDAYVQNRNLILGHGAKADSIPRLEIRCHDVRCGHGATAGHIDEDQRFYLTSRGIPGSEADRLIVRGFFDDALQSLRSPAFAQVANAVLDGRLDEISLDELSVER